MGLFNFFNKHNSSPQTEQTSSASEQPNQWDSLAAAPFDQATPAPEAAPRPTEGNAQRIQRQGDKIIASFLYSPSVLNSKTVDISDADRERFYDAIADDAITPAQQSEFLRNIALPIGPPNHENPAPVMQKLSTDRHYLKILAYTGGLGAETTNNIKPGMPATEQFTITLQNLLQQYPTPIEFAEREQYMMDRLRNAGNTTAKLAEYEDAFEDFKQITYGERYEYFKTFQALQSLADSRAKSRLDATVAAEQLDSTIKLRAPIAPSQEQIDNNPYMAPEARQYYAPQDHNSGE